jgi:hypothetical protein
MDAGEINALRYHPNVTALVPPAAPRDQDLERLRSRLGELEQLLLQRDTEVARTRADLAAFAILYRRQVGLLHEELDRLDLAIAEAELDEISRRVAQGADAPGEPPAQSGGAESPARFTTDAVRKLFREVARAIHPDLARDASTRDRRHWLMIEANRAYALGDEERLRSILQAWERSPEAVQGSDAEATGLRLARRIAQLEEQLELLSRDLGSLRDTPMWKLKVMVDDDAARGKDLVEDMVRRLKRDILAATNRLDALRPPDAVR